MKTTELPSGSNSAPYIDEIDPAVHAKRWFTLATLCLSLLIIVMDNTILNVAIPSLMNDLGASNSQVQWIVDSYVLVFAGLLLTAGQPQRPVRAQGRPAARHRAVRHRLGCGRHVESANQLIFTRAFMGIGGALIMPATLSILTNVFRDPKERGRAIAVWAGFSGLGVAIGPMTGGFLLEHFSWQLGVLGQPAASASPPSWLGYFFVPTSRDPIKSKLDPVGAVLSSSASTSLVRHHRRTRRSDGPTRIVRRRVRPRRHRARGFIVWELHTSDPMLDLSVFRNARFSAASGRSRSCSSPCWARCS